MIKIRIYCSTNKVGSRCEDVVEVEKVDWEEMSDKEKGEFVLEQLQSMQEWGWEEVE